MGQNKETKYSRQPYGTLLRRIIMWYFAWILGVLLACSFGIINAMWLENQEALDEQNKDTK